MVPANASENLEKDQYIITGNNSKHDATNENAHLLIDFRKERNMVVKSTYFLHKDVQKGTWRTVYAKTSNNIDHILLEKSGEKHDYTYINIQVS